MDSTAVDARIPSMLCCLRDSLADSSWPIRDSACTAAGRMLRSLWGRVRFSQQFIPRAVPIPSAVDIVHAAGDGSCPPPSPSPPLPNEPLAMAVTPTALAEENTGEQTTLEGVPVSIRELCQESLHMLFSFLLEDPFRPVRDSAAVGIVDAILPPLPLPSQPTGFTPADTTTRVEDVEEGRQLQLETVSRLADFLATHIESACMETRRDTAPPSVPTAGGGTKSSSKRKPSTTRGAAPGFQFIPPAMLADMAQHADAVRKSQEGQGQKVTTTGGGVQQKHFGAHANSTSAGNPSAVSIGSSVEEVSADEIGPSSVSWGTTVGGRRRRTKGRAGGGWGCCLDCAPGEGKGVLSWEKSEACVLLLREVAQALQGRECRRDFSLGEVLRGILSSRLEVCGDTCTLLSGYLICPILSCRCRCAGSLDAS